MKYIKKTIRLLDNYLIARLTHRPSAAAFWYLPEPAILKTPQDFQEYKQSSTIAPRYFMDYRQKLNYSLENDDGIIVLPYDEPIGKQINPEAAFQYALGLHDTYLATHDSRYLNRFFHYAAYFVKRQTEAGLWEYTFDWYGSKAPWHSALAQARGASVMFRAWRHSKESRYHDACVNSLTKFSESTATGGFRHQFKSTNAFYFEEYPKSPTGVINGFMAALISIWELKYWLKEPIFISLWDSGIRALETMLPHYSTAWWSLYDLDPKTPVKNVNSPRYHLLELNYLQILSLIAESQLLTEIYQTRKRQYQNFIFRQRALGQKFLRKIIYK